MFLAPSTSVPKILVIGAILLICGGAHIIFEISNYDGVSDCDLYTTYCAGCLRGVAISMSFYFVILQLNIASII